jgi:adenine phosphoribosyltransferase
MTYELHLPGVTRHLPICPVNENLSIAAFVLFGDTELTERSAEALARLAPPHDVMITAESKGIPLICSMARILGENRYILARKGPKLYMQDVVKVQVNSITTDHMQILCLGKDEREQLYGKRVLIVDDVISTGESLAALETLVDTVGGKIAGKFTVLAEGEAADRTDITFLEYLPLFNSDGTPQ